MPELTAAELARIVNGRLVGPGGARVRAVCSLADAGAEDIAFLRSDRLLDQAARCGAGVLISAVEVPGYAGALVVCEDADVAMAKVLDLFVAERWWRPQGVSARASVSPTAELAPDAAVGDFAFIGDETVIGEGAVIFPLAYVGARCRVGARTMILPHASVHDRTRIGADCIIHYNATLGAEGFGFVQRGGHQVKLSQLGGVWIGDRVEIGAHAAVDRAMVEDTVVGDGCKVDNHCQIAHNCRLGPDCILAGYARLAGSVTLGRGVIVAADVGIKDHVTIGDGAVIGAGSGVHGDVPAGAVIFGYPARPIREAERILAYQARVPDMAKRLRELERQVAELQARLGGRPGQA